MKLIDLLVMELPKHGGWPEDVECIEQASDGSLFDARQLAKPYLFSEHHFALANDWNEAEIIREQYETGLAESGRKREIAVRAMMSCSAVLLEVTAGLIYDAIAAGEIPHITLK